MTILGVAAGHACAAWQAIKVILILLLFAALSAALGVAGWWLTDGRLAAAPLPFAKPARPAPEPAVYLCLWGGADGILFDLRLYPGGKYECRRAGEPGGKPLYAGTWSQDGLTLVVRERGAGAGPDAPFERWSVGPEGATTGEARNEAFILLERVR
jgi:hypothetical protein